MMLGKLAKLAAPLHISAIRLCGPARFGGAELTAIYLGNGANLNFLASIFFRQTRLETLAAGLNPLQLRTTLARLAGDSDVLLSELPPLWAPLLTLDGTIRFPAWVRQEIDLPGTAGSPDPWLLPRALEREAARRIRRHGYAMDFTTDSATFALFFRNFYRPYVQSRFGSQSIVDQESTFMARCRGQTLARLHAGNEWVAGVLLKRRGRNLRFGRFGAAVDPPSPGASEVLDTLVIHHAHKQGVRRIIMGDTRPCLADGVLRYKARFGARIRPTLFPQPTLCIDVRRWITPVVTALTNQPLVALRERTPHVWRIHGESASTHAVLEALDTPSTNAAIRQVVDRG